MNKQTIAILILIVLSALGWVAVLTLDILGIEELFRIGSYKVTWK